MRPSLKTQIYMTKNAGRGVWGSSPSKNLAIFSLKWCIFASFMSFFSDINLKNVHPEEKFSYI